jgi:amidase
MSTLGLLELAACTSSRSRRTESTPSRNLNSKLYYSSATALADAIQKKQISSVEVVTSFLNRIQEVNPRLNAVFQVQRDQALQEARAADAALARNERKGPLHGVPMTIKDSFDTAGVISTGGTKGRSQYVPREDATIVARLKASGAILLGKTNTPELTLAWETDNLVYGRTNNPYDLKRSPGASSGGAAALIAAGGTPFDIGTDTGGSIRLPAHFCGIAGIRPTSGRVPRTGHIISYVAGPIDSMTQVGPMARFVEDLGLILPIIAGPDWRDPAIVPMPLGKPEDVDLKTLRIAFHTDNGILTPTPEIMDTVRNAAKACSNAGCTVEEKRPAPLPRVSDLLRNSWVATDGIVDRILKAAGTTERGPFLQPPPKPPKPMSLVEYTGVLEEIDRFRSEMLTFMKDYDVILCPVNAHVALPPGAAEKENERGAFTYTQAYNVTGWGGAVVRAGTSPEGLPIGVEIVPRPWREDAALAVAAVIEAKLGGWKPPTLDKS